ncbi:conserved hypothetical protein [Culex quinquefasciatus]|uniref:Janus kinase and microtubule-interacting protein C-terminal domain-containing protein n=1 Tax=Culex quinquefasciatus TaxID=7176 RepID=B0WXB1_CULQU|nr:conserved hypothetical protein [Culex quinquefasciatus]|eukprot:XP_001862033.1 conserved hypothetical protein [Culex quinquefasciatus]
MTTAMRQLSTVSDADSAISSAPASLSPQPTSCPNSPEVWRAHPGHDHQQQQQQLHLQSLRDQSQLAEIKLELDRMQAKYDLLSADYGKAKDQIDTLERELLETTQSARERVKLADRIEYLEQREESLLRESHELREQNELLEFRIIELEESHDKMRKVREPEPCSGTVSKSTSHSSIQSSVCEEELEQHNAETDRVAAVRSTGKSATTTTATFCCKCSPAAAAAINWSTPEVTTTTKTTSASRVDERQANITNIVYCSNGSNVELGLDTTTCGDDSSSRSKPHESRTMEAHNDDESQPASASVRLSEPSVHPRTTIMTTAMRQLSTVSDADSAISSAPASLSPQPTSCPNSPEVWRAHPGHDHQQQQQQQLHLQSLRDQSQLAEIKLELDRMQAKYDLLSADYGKAKDQIDTLERELLETTQSARERVKLADRIEYLEQREESLLRESHELREQNELLEFRIIELEESHDKI